MKYPRTKHLPWSPGSTRDDRILSTEGAKSLICEPIVITEKIDGSNICMTYDALFARSHSGSPNHPSFSLAKAKHAVVKWLIPEGLSVFIEYTYAVHSIAYTSMSSCFWVIGARDNNSSSWLSVLDLEAVAQSLEMPIAPVLFSGIVTSLESLQETVVRLAKRASRLGGDREGVVVRPSASFVNFDGRVGKYVRENHVQTDQHWSKCWKPQKLKTP